MSRSSLRSWKEKYQRRPAITAITPTEIPMPTPIEAPFERAEWETVALEGAEVGVVSDIGNGFDVENDVDKLVGRTIEDVSVRMEVISG
jgi:hypothetical protein